jgi:hypothetical protein
LTIYPHAYPAGTQIVRANCGNLCGFASDKTVHGLSEYVFQSSVPEYPVQQGSRGRVQSPLTCEITVRRDGQKEDLGQVPVVVVLVSAEFMTRLHHPELNSRT